MKLVFPGGEHPQVLLGPGVNRVGSDPHSNIVLNRPGVLPQHCQLHVTPSGVMLDVPQGTTVSVNGRQVDGLIALPLPYALQAWAVRGTSALAYLCGTARADASAPSPNR